MVIPENKIISITEFLRNFKEISHKLETDEVNFIFKNNKPDKVIMTFEKYKKVIELLDYLEHKTLYDEIKDFEKNDTHKRYSHEEILNLLE